MKSFFKSHHWWYSQEKDGNFSIYWEIRCLSDKKGNPASQDTKHAINEVTKPSPAKQWPSREFSHQLTSTVMASCAAMDLKIHLSRKGAQWEV